MKKDDTIHLKENPEILTFMFESTDEEFQAFTGSIPITDDLHQQIVTKLEKLQCTELLEQFLNQ